MVKFALLADPGPELQLPPPDQVPDPFQAPLFASVQFLAIAAGDRPTIKTTANPMPATVHKK